MVGEYWFHTDPLQRHIHVGFLFSRLENMDAFLAMSRTAELRRILEDLRNYQGGWYRTSPGEYLSLTVEDGCVTAEIHLVDALPCRMAVGFFRQLVTDYLAEWDAMLAQG